MIGKDGKIPWFVRGEQARFKAITMGHPIIMGRNTHQSIGRTLPGRLNIVISSDPNLQLSEGSRLAHSFEEAVSMAEDSGAEEVFVIGGERVFKDAQPLADKLYLTKVHTEVEGDTFFQFDPKQWKMISCELFKKNEVPDRPFDFEVCLYERTSS
nr:Dihydrofolate reductase [uncultured bacterium]